MTVRGATGEDHMIYLHPVTVSVGYFTFRTSAAFADLPHLESAGLAGQRGFFDHFRIRFDCAAGEFELEPGPRWAHA